MKNSNFRPILSVIALFALSLATNVSYAGPVRMGNVKQVVSSNPNRQSATSTAQLLISPGDTPDGEGDGNNRQTVGAQQDDRVIVEEQVEVVEEPCNCPEYEVKRFETTRGGFPWWALGFVPIPFVALCCKGDNDSPTPTPTLPFSSPSPSISESPSPSPSVSPSPSPSVSPSPSPSESPSPSPSPSPSISPSPSPSVSPSPSPSASVTPSPSPSGSPKMSPSPSPTGSISPSPKVSITPRVTPSGTPPQIPEPTTILLFGTGLSGIGFAARRWLRNRRKNENEESEDSE